MSLASRIARRISRGVSSVGSSLEDTVRDPRSLVSGAAYFGNPLIAQDIAGASLGGALSRGADPRVALREAGGANASLAAGGSSQQAFDLLAFNAALAAGAATGGLTSSVLYTSPAAAAAGLAPIGTVAGSTLGALAAGTGTYAAAQAARAATGEDGGAGGGATPPDVNEANDPNMAVQFKRLRKAARALGRAGTIKSKGSSTLGLGEQVLGDQLSLVGS